MDSENEQSYHQVKTRRFVLDNKNKCQNKRNHSSTHVPPFCFGSSVGSSNYRVEETAALLKAEDAQSNALELFFKFRQLYRWPKRTGYNLAIFTRDTMHIPYIFGMISEF